MRKHLKLIRNEKGQMLLFVLISASIIIVLFIGAVKLYMNTIEDSRFLLEQIDVETIVQMSKVDLVNLTQNPSEQPKSFYHYVYPNGDIYLNIKISDNKYLITNEIELKNESIYESAYKIDIE